MTGWSKFNDSIVNEHNVVSSNVNNVISSNINNVISAIWSADSDASLT